MNLPVLSSLDSILLSSVLCGIVIAALRNARIGGECVSGGG